MVESVEEFAMLNDFGRVDGLQPTEGPVKHGYARVTREPRRKQKPVRFGQAFMDSGQHVACRRFVGSGFSSY
ncbi:MAG: hypothetical protein OXU70_21055 [Gammaproteobacteria bacterium]|nr:hypothetical protein [Gammaproteobacteria bacterium]